MKRAALTIMVCLLLGAIINVAVAWGFVLWTPAMLTAQSPIDAWPVRVPEEWPPVLSRDSAARVGLSFSGASGDNFKQTMQVKRARLDALYALASKAEGPMQERLSTYKEIDDLSTSITLDSEYVYARVGVLSSGLPLRSVCSERGWWADYTSMGSTALSEHFDTWKAGIRIPDWIPWCAHEQTDLRRLPILIIPLGFAVNTVFYGGLIAVVVFAWTWLPRFCRLRKGCCIACGYDLRGAPHERCPECGRQLPPHGATSATRMKRASS